ncbi:MAG: ParB/RepB/Spo0J family partition protein [Oligoflexales bacterium]
MKKSKIEKGIDKIGSNIQETLLVQDEKDEWPQEKFNKLMQAFEKSEQIASEIPISIIRHDKNIRRKIDDLNIDSLASDIERDGLIHPPTITLEKDEKGYYFLMIAGHRRLLAYKKLGRRRIPVTIRLYKTDSDRLIASFTENNSRKNMDIFDLASSFKVFRDSGLSYNDISEKTGFDKTTVTRYIRFDNWSNNLVKLVRDNTSHLPLRFLTSLLSKEKFDDETRLIEIKNFIDHKNKGLGSSKKNKESISDTRLKRQGAEARVIEAINVRELDPGQLQLLSTILLEARIIKKSLIDDARVHLSSLS